MTGNWGDKTINPALPMTPKEIAESAFDAYKAGASIVHLHMRDEEGQPTMRTDLFKETIELIREKCDAIINMTSSGGHSLDGMAADETRMIPFKELNPEMGSYDCGTMKWLHKTAFENNPQFLESLGKLYQEIGTKALGGHVRVELEDNTYYEHGVLAKSNAQLVEWAANIICAAGFKVATHSEARQVLKLKKLLILRRKDDDSFYKL